MNILGIESSCDETAVAVVANGTDVLSSLVLSQVDVHRVFGGVIPEIAAREHLKVIDQLVHAGLSEANVCLQDIAAIAVTQGPGLIGALLVGVSYAKGLALGSGLKLVPVNHVHAHIHGALVGKEAPEYPCLALVVSGGHTNIYYMKSPTQLELMAYTLDDACGECFDKVAKLFGLGYPGGPIVEKMAKTGDSQNCKMPRMVEDSRKLVFSYSGLKTYMVNLHEREKLQLTPSRVADVLAAFQDEALGQLVRKLQSVRRLKPQAKMILIAGGVAANLRFRQLMAQEIDIPVQFPNLKYCSDNAAMIAGMGYHLYQTGLASSADFDDISWDCYSRYPYEKT